MLNELGKNGTIASKNLKEATGKTFQQMIKEGKNLGDILSAMDKHAKKSGKSLSDMFGSAEASKSALLLANNEGKDFNTMLGKMEKSAGATDTAFKKMSATSTSQLTKSLNEGKNTLIEFGDIVAPVISKISKGLHTAITFIKGLSKSQKEALVNASAFIIGLTAVAKVVSVVSGSVKTMIETYGKLKPVFEIVGKGLGKLKGAFNLVKIAIGYVGTAIQGIITLLGAISPVGWAVIITTVVVGALTLLYKKCDWFRNKVDYVAKSIAYFFTTTIPNSLQKFGDMCTNFFANLKEKIWNSLAQVYHKICNTCSEAYNSVSDWISKTYTSVSDWFTKLGAKIWECLVGAYNKVVTWGYNVFTSATNTASNVIHSVTSYFSQLPNSIWTWLCNVISKIQTWGSNMYNTACNSMSRMCNGIINTISNLPSKMWSIGSNIVKGLWSGITGSAGWLWDKVSGFCNNIVQGFKNTLQIHSPSRLLRDEVGKYIAQGVGVGFEGEMENVNIGMKKTMLHSVEHSIKPTFSSKDLKKLDNRLEANVKTEQKLFVIVNNETKLDGKVIAKATHTEVGRMLSKDEKSFRMAKGGR